MLTYIEGAAKGYYDYSGTFLNDKFHGIGQQRWTNFTYEGEYKTGKRHGKATLYMTNGKVFNIRYKNGKEIPGTETEVTDSGKAWYGAATQVVSSVNASISQIE